MKHCIQLILCALLLGTGALHAQIPQMIAYQGRVVAGGVNFHGTGQFKFAIVRGNYGGAPGEPLNLWSNDGSLPSTDGTNAPTAAVSLACDRGLYSVLLGNTAAGMVAVPPSVFANPDVRLRVWFNDGTHGWQKLTPDQRLVSVGYAMMADSATTAQTAQTVADNAITSAKIASGAVTSAKLGLGSVTSSAIANGSVTVGALADGSVTNAKLGSNAVSSASILDGTITSADIFDGTIGTADLANGAVTAAKIAGNTITAAEIAPAAVATSELADASVTNAKLTAGAVGTQQIQSSAVRGLEILDGSIGNGDLADGSVTAPKIAGNTITAQEIGPGAVGTSELADLSVSTADLANASITSSKLASLAVTSSALADNAVSTAKLQNVSVTYDKLALNSVTETEIVDGSVQTAELANRAVTADKLAHATAGVVTTPATDIPNTPGTYSGVLLVPWTTEVADTASIYAPASPTAMTIPRTGLYMVTLNTYFSSSSNQRNTLSLRRNANSTENGGESLANASIENTSRVNLTTLVPLTAGDVLQVWAYSERLIGTFYPATYVQGRFSLVYLGSLP